jgi:phosphoribosyl 1,2-cyclic phosphodiesterase
MSASGEWLRLKGCSMPLRFTVLASGSAGNASLVESEEFGVLIDIGLGPRHLGARLAAIGYSWAAVHAVVLTHTHTDHCRAATLAHLRRQRIPLYCHAEHRRQLGRSRAFSALAADGLVRDFDTATDVRLAAGLTCRPVPLRHDGGPTFGFRFDGSPDLFGHAPTLAYAADLGCWDDSLVEHLAGADLLAVEFNHDVELERTSGRHPYLVARVLGDEGHLSNEQAARLLQAVLARSDEGRPHHVVQLHLSRDCNLPALARAAARAVLPEHIAVHTALQDAPGPTLVVGRDIPVRRPRPPRPRRFLAPLPLQPSLFDALADVG